MSSILHLFPIVDFPPGKPAHKMLPVSPVWFLPDSNPAKQELVFDGRAHWPFLAHLAIAETVLTGRRDDYAARPEPNEMPPPALVGLEHGEGHKRWADIDLNPTD